MNLFLIREVYGVCGNDPVHEVVVRDVREGESSKYWAWWSNKEEKFLFVFTDRSLVSTFADLVEPSFVNEGDAVWVFVAENRVRKSIVTCAAGMHARVATRRNDGITSEKWHDIRTLRVEPPVTKKVM